MSQQSNATAAAIGTGVVETMAAKLRALIAGSDPSKPIDPAAIAALADDFEAAHPDILEGISQAAAVQPAAAVPAATATAGERPPTMVPAPVPAPAEPASWETKLSLALPQVVTLIALIASAAVPGATVAGLSIAQLTGIGLGVANAVPAAVDAWNEIQAVANSGLPPTDEQWAKWNAAADDAHSQLQDAANQVISGKVA